MHGSSWRKQRRARKVRLNQPASTRSSFSSSQNGMRLEIVFNPIKHILIPAVMFVGCAWGFLYFFRPWGGNAVAWLFAALGLLVVARMIRYMRLPPTRMVPIKPST